MNIETKLLNGLKQAQAEFALESLRKPSSRDTFEYGYRVGHVAGQEAAINLLLQLLKEEKELDNI